MAKHQNLRSKLSYFTSSFKLRLQRHMDVAWPDFIISSVFPAYFLPCPPKGNIGVHEPLSGRGMAKVGTGVYYRDLEFDHVQAAVKLLYRCTKLKIASPADALLYQPAEPPTFLCHRIILGALGSPTGPQSRTRNNRPMRRRHATKTRRGSAVACSRDERGRPAARAS